MTETQEQAPQAQRQNFPQPASEQPPGRAVLNREAPQGQPQTAGPSTVATVDHLAQVMVDQWGHRGEYIKGDILDRGALNPAHYDWDHAVRMGVLRLLTHAEARSWPTTTPLDDTGGVDQDHRRAMRYAAGISPDVPRTVTTASGPPEPAEFAKPTLAGPDNNQEAARPVVVVDSALEAETEGTRALRTVATSSGPVYESASERTAREAAASEQASGRRKTSGSAAAKGAREEG